MTQFRLLQGLVVLGACASLGCAAANTARATDYFPVAPDGYWIYEGANAGKPVRAGIRGNGVDDEGRPKLELASQPGDVMSVTVRMEDGFMVLHSPQFQLHVLPEHPEEVRVWTWEAGGEEWRGRILQDDAFVVVPAGRYADVLVVELGPVARDGERWRWYFVIGVGPVMQRSIGGATATMLELVSREPGTPVPLVARATPEVTPSPIEPPPTELPPSDAPPPKPANG